MLASFSFYLTHFASAIFVTVCQLLSSACMFNELGIIILLMLFSDSIPLDLFLLSIEDFFYLHCPKLLLLLSLLIFNNGETLDVAATCLTICRSQQNIECLRSLNSGKIVSNLVKMSDSSGHNAILLVLQLSFRKISQDLELFCHPV